MAYIVDSLDSPFGGSVNTHIALLAPHQTGDLLLVCLSQDGGTGTVENEKKSVLVQVTADGEVWCWKDHR